MGSNQTSLRQVRHDLELIGFIIKAEDSCSLIRCFERRVGALWVELCYFDLERIVTEAVFDLFE